MRYAILLILVLVSACQHRPVEELVLADVAVKAAQKMKAESLAPDSYRKAENFFLRAKKDFEEGYFDSCRKYANEARLLAEQAEYQALFKQSHLKGQSYGGAEEDPFSAEPPATPQDE